MSNGAIEWAKANPLIAGGGAVAIILIVIVVSSGSSSSSSADAQGSAGVAAYYQAVSNQAQAGAAIQVAQIGADAGTNQALIAASYGLQKDAQDQPAVLASIEATRATSLAQTSADAATTSLAIETAHAISDNTIALQNNQLAAQTALGNAALTVQQNIAFKQANVQKSSNLLNNIFGTISSAIKIVPGLT